MSKILIVDISNGMDFKNPPSNEDFFIDWELHNGRAFGYDAEEVVRKDNNGVAVAFHRVKCDSSFYERDEYKFLVCDPSDVKTHEGLRYVPGGAFYVVSVTYEPVPLFTAKIVAGEKKFSEIEDF